MVDNLRHGDITYWLHGQPTRADHDRPVGRTAFRRESPSLSAADADIVTIVCCASSPNRDRKSIRRFAASAGDCHRLWSHHGCNHRGTMARFSRAGKTQPNRIPAARCSFRRQPPSAVTRGGLGWSFDRVASALARTGGSDRATPGGATISPADPPFPFNQPKPR